LGFGVIATAAVAWDTGKTMFHSATDVRVNIGGELYSLQYALNHRLINAVIQDSGDVAGEAPMSGTWCGMRMTAQLTPIKECDGHDPLVNCPAGYTKNGFAAMGDSGGTWYTCFKN